MDRAKWARSKKCIKSLTFWTSAHTVHVHVYVHIFSIRDSPTLLFMNALMHLTQWCCIRRNRVSFPVKPLLTQDLRISSSTSNPLHSPNFFTQLFEKFYSYMIKRYYKNINNIYNIWCTRGMHRIYTIHINLCINQRLYNHSVCVCVSFSLFLGVLLLNLIIYSRQAQRQI